MAVTPPAAPTRASDSKGRYIFVGWHCSTDNDFYTSDRIGASTEGITVYTALYYIFNGTATSGTGSSIPSLPSIPSSSDIADLIKGSGIDMSQVIAQMVASGIIDPAQIMAGLIASGAIDPKELMEAMIASGAIDMSQLMADMLDPASLMSQADMGAILSAYFSSMSPEQLMAMMGVDLSSAFNFSEEDLKKMMAENGIDLSSDSLALMLAQMSGSTPSSYREVLQTLGYFTLDQPSAISFYPTDLAGKEVITGFIDDYNDQVESDTDRMTYNDLIAALTDTLKTIVNAISYILIAFVAISLIVSSIMIAIITYISVLERTKEIGILRALGASKKDVSKIFNAETFIEGLISGALGVGVSMALCIPISMIASHLIGSTFTASVPMAAGITLIIISVILTLIAGFFPSRIAAKKDPVLALRSE